MRLYAVVIGSLILLTAVGVIVSLLLGDSGQGRYLPILLGCAGAEREDLTAVSQGPWEGVAQIRRGLWARGCSTYAVGLLSTALVHPCTRDVPQVQRVGSISPITPDRGKPNPKRLYSCGFHHVAARWCKRQNRT